MARDGAGNMAIPYTSFTAGQKIKSAEVNADFSTIVSELTNSMPRDGQAAPTHDIPFGSYKITGLGAGSAATDALNLGQAQAQAFAWCGTAGGTKNALTLTPSPAITAYAAGQLFRFIAASTSDDVVTVAVSGLATKSLKYRNAALGAFYSLVAGRSYAAFYDGTAFQIIGAIDDHSSALDPVVTASSLAAAKVAFSVVGTIVKQVFTSSGTYTPTSGMLYCLVEAVGGGGGGGGCPTTSASQAAVSGGGGAGGYCRSLLSASDIGASQTVTIGAAGAAAGAGAYAGANGGSTSLGALVVAAGGTGGTAGAAVNYATGTPGGAGGAATTSNILGINGQNGGFGMTSVSGGGYYGLGGKGGSGPLGSGGAASFGSAGPSGTGYGSGGAGSAIGQSTSAVGGGGGGGGAIIITEFCAA